MSLMRPWSEFQRDMDTLFNQFNMLSPMSRHQQQGAVAPVANWFPSIELSESKDKKDFTLKAEIPGVNPDDINIEAEDNNVVISGEIRKEHEQNEENVYRSEFQYGMFRRSVPLPESIDPNSVTAAYKNGVLTVTLPKSETSKRKKIHVESKK